MQQVRPIGGTRPLVQLRARVTPNGGNGDLFACAVDFVVGALVPLAPAFPRGAPEIVGGGAIALRYAGAWKHEPR